MHSLGCSDVGKFFNDSLPDHFLVQLIRDSEVKPKAQQKSLARASLPSGLFLMPSALGRGGLGVYTTSTIEGTAVFGPFKGMKISFPNVENGLDYLYSWDVRMSMFWINSFLYVCIHSFVRSFVRSFVHACMPTNLHLCILNPATKRPGKSGRNNKMAGLKGSCYKKMTA